MVTEDRRNFTPEQISDLLRREVPLIQVPVESGSSNCLAVIASLNQETPDDLNRYAQYLNDELGHLSPEGVQILLADNTEKGQLMGCIEKQFSLLSETGFSIYSTYVSNRGKVHGLNACLQKVNAPVVVSVDMNKQPSGRTLLGLYKAINSNQADLVSARIYSRRTGQRQHWNAGAAYAGKRWCFPGFPEVMNDDEYTLRLTLARGGRFLVRDDLKVIDLKGLRKSTSVERNRRAARTAIGSLQLDHLTVINGDESYILGQHRVEALPPQGTAVGRMIGNVYSLIRQAPREQVHIVRSVIAGYSSKTSYHEAYGELLDRLIENPSMCAW